MQITKKVNCWGTGSSFRDYLHIDDLGRAFVFALEKWELDKDNSPKYLNGHPIPFLNVVAGLDISIKE